MGLKGVLASCKSRCSAFTLDIIDTVIVGLIGE